MAVISHGMEALLLCALVRVAPCLQRGDLVLRELLLCALVRVAPKHTNEYVCYVVFCSVHLYESLRQKSTTLL